MALDEQAWIGAMIEAEGSVSKPYGPHLQWRIGVGNTDLEIISALLRVTGVGTIHLQPPSKLGRKTCWTWQVQAANDVAAIVKQCAPYSMKLRRIEKGV